MKSKYILILILLSSCSLQKRAANKMNWLKSHGFVSSDSIIIRDTLRGFDTTFIRQFDTLTSVDTFEVLREGIKVKTVIRWKERIVEQQITKRDTIITNVCPPQITHIETWWEKHDFYIGLIIGLLVAFITVLILIFKKLIK